MKMTAWPESLRDLVFIPRIDERLDELAALAEPEEWTWHSTPATRSKPVLLSYLLHTYKRLAEEGKIVVSCDGTQLTFNTGLATPNQEPIFALANPNLLPDPQQPWHFHSWCRKGQAELRCFDTLPEIARYYGDPSELVFDVRKELRVNIEHIVADNKARFPEPWRKVADFALLTFLKGAIDNARERIQRDYKIAVPQCYRGRVQLLLPLCLWRPDRADVALVVQPYDTFYRACTCLTLDMAYSNARQLARPHRGWLRPGGF